MLDIIDALRDLSSKSAFQSRGIPKGDELMEVNSRSTNIGRGFSEPLAGRM